MNRSASALLLVASLTAAPAFAGGFEGTIEMTMTTPQGDGKMTVSVGKSGVRSDTQMTAQGMPVEMSVLMKANQKNVAYLINAKQKSYAEIDLVEARKMAADQDTKWTAKKIGKEKLLGYSTVHAEVSNDKGLSMEVWTTKDLNIDPSVLEAMGGNSPSDSTMMKALKSAGADGFMVKMVSTGKGGGTTLQVTKVEKKSVPAATFEIPAGFTKSQTGPAGAMMTPEQAKQMEEAMRQMTPEQRKMLEDMMKQKMKAQAK